MNKKVFVSLVALVVLCLLGIKFYNLLLCNNQVGYLQQYGDYSMLQYFYEKEGQYPDNLDELDLSYFDTQDYLEEERPNPYLDPFGSGGYLVYAPLKKNDRNVGYILYSLGFNGKDDNKNLVESANEHLGERAYRFSGISEPVLNILIKNDDIFISRRW